VQNNIVYTCQGESHLGLNRIALKVKAAEFHVVNQRYKLFENQAFDCFVRIRYRQPLQSVKVLLKGDFVYVLFNELQRGIAPGQFAAFYLEDELIFSGVIMN